MSQLLTIAEDYLDPLKYKLIIKSPDESQTTYTFDSFDTSNAPFDLTNIDVNLNVGATGDFSFSINDTKDRVIKDTIGCGAVAIIQAAKKQADYRNIMYGIIDEIEDSYPQGNALIYSFRGLGFGVILNYTLLNMIKSANKEDLLNGNTIVGDPNFRIDNLVTKLFTSIDVLPIENSPLLIDRGGFLIDSIADSINVFMPAVNSPLATASTLLENFAATSGTVLHIDPDKNVFMRPPYVKHSGITIRQWEVDPITGLPLRLTDPQDVTSYYFGGWSSKRFMKVEQGFFNRVFLTINTDTVIATSASTEEGVEPIPTFESLANKDICVQFIPGSTQLFNIALLLSKTGDGRSSVDDSYDLTGVQGLICEDNGSNQPGSKIIALFNIPYEDINTSPTVIYKMDLEYKVSNIDQNKLHWIILFKRGESEDNTIRWYHDADFLTESTDTVPRRSGIKRPFTAQPNPDKINFNAGFGTSSKGPVYRYSFFLSNKTTIEVSDPISIKKYTPNRPIEIRVNAPWINDIKTGFRYANTLLQYGAKLKRIYEKKKLSIPNNMFFPLTIANIIYPPAGITQNSNITAEINNVHYGASGFDADSPFGSYFCELTAVGYVNHNQEFLGDSIICSE